MEGVYVKTEPEPIPHASTSEPPVPLAVPLEAQPCRLCANIPERAIEIYSTEGLSNQLSDRINEYLPVKVSPDDKLPLCCCWTCVTTLLSFHELVVACVESEKRLQVVLTEPKPIPIPVPIPAVPDPEPEIPEYNDDDAEMMDADDGEGDDDYEPENDDEDEESEEETKPIPGTSDDTEFLTIEETVVTKKEIVDPAEVPMKIPIDTASCGKVKFVGFENKLGLVLKTDTNSLPIPIVKKQIDDRRKGYKKEIPVEIEIESAETKNVDQTKEQEVTTVRESTVKTKENLVGTNTSRKKIRTDKVKQAGRNNVGHQIKLKINQEVETSVNLLGVENQLTAITEDDQNSAAINKRNSKESTQKEGVGETDTYIIQKETNRKSHEVVVKIGELEIPVYTFRMDLGNKRETKNCTNNKLQISEENEGTKVNSPVFINERQNTREIKEHSTSRNEYVETQIIKEPEPQVCSIGRRSLRQTKNKGNELRITEGKLETQNTKKIEATQKSPKDIVRGENKIQTKLDNYFKITPMKAATNKWRNQTIGSNEIQEEICDLTGDDEVMTPEQKSKNLSKFGCSKINTLKGSIISKEVVKNKTEQSKNENATVSTGFKQSGCGVISDANKSEHVQNSSVLENESERQSRVLRSRKSVPTRSGSEHKRGQNQMENPPDKEGSLGQTRRAAENEAGFNLIKDKPEQDHTQSKPDAKQNPNDENGLISSKRVPRSRFTEVLRDKSKQNIAAENNQILIDAKELNDNAVQNQIKLRSDGENKMTNVNQPKRRNPKRRVTETSSCSNDEFTQKRIKMANLPESEKKTLAEVNPVIVVQNKSGNGGNEDTMINKQKVEDLSEISVNPAQLLEGVCNEKEQKQKENVPGMKRNITPRRKDRKRISQPKNKLAVEKQKPRANWVNFKKHFIMTEEDGIAYFKCNICSRKVLHGKNLVRHFNTFHCETKTAKDHTLQYSKQSEKILKKGLCKENGKTFYKCAECSRTTFSKKYFLLHILSHQPGETENRIVWSERIRMHSRIINKEGEVLHKCDICQSIFNIPRHCVRHYLRHEDVLKSNIKRYTGFLEKSKFVNGNGQVYYKCKDCDVIVQKWMVIPHHVGHVKNGDLCQEGTLTKEAEEVILTRERDAEITKRFKILAGEDGISNCICDLCGYKSTNNKMLVHYKTQHSDDILFVCTHCGEKFFYNSGLVRHLQDAHNIGVTNEEVEDGDQSKDDALSESDEDENGIEEEEDSFNEDGDAIEDDDNSVVEEGTEDISYVDRTESVCYECDLCGQVFVDSKQHEDHYVSHFKLTEM